MELRELFRGEIEKIGIAPHLSAREPGGRTVIDNRFEHGGAKLSHEDLLRELFTWLSQQRPGRVQSNRPSHRAWRDQVHCAGPHRRLRNGESYEA